MGVVNDTDFQAYGKPVSETETNKEEKTEE